MSALLFTVLEADYHRNGVAGEGFYVGVIRDQDGRKLLTYFPEYDQAGEIIPHRTGRVAVVDVDEAALGNIYMHPQGYGANGQPGGNAWRGDHYCDAARAIVAAVEARR